MKTKVIKFGNLKQLVNTDMKAFNDIMDDGDYLIATYKHSGHKLQKNQIIFIGFTYKAINYNIYKNNRLQTCEIFTTFLLD